jgi:membrane protein YdbS with pleckstrin-like domain
MPPRVETTDPEGVDFGWVMQVTFVVTIVVGAPVVAVTAIFAELPTWGQRAAFAVRVGAVVWLLTAVGVYLYARRQSHRDQRRNP